MRIKLNYLWKGSYYFSQNVTEIFVSKELKFFGQVRISLTNRKN
jgi:hypothetical protein